MLLSALTLAALLQAAPAPTSVVIPQAPVVGQMGAMLQRKPFDAAQSVDQLRMRSPKAARPAKAPFKVKALRVSCASNGLSRASHPETLAVQPLSKLPKAHGERAVARLVDGCPVPVLIAQNDPLH